MSPTLSRQHQDVTNLTVTCQPMGWHGYFVVRVNSGPKTSCLNPPHLTSSSSTRINVTEFTCQRAINGLYKTESKPTSTTFEPNMHFVNLFSLLLINTILCGIGVGRKSHV